MHSYYTRWQHNLGDWWRSAISSHFDQDDYDGYNNGPNKHYWYYNEETDAECVDDDDSPPATKPNIIFVLGDDWGNQYLYLLRVKT